MGVQGQYQDGTQFDWLTEDAVKDSFSPLQLDVFHALSEDYHELGVAPRPPGSLTRGGYEGGCLAGVSVERGSWQGAPRQTRQRYRQPRKGLRLLRPILASGVQRWRLGGAHQEGAAARRCFSRADPTAVLERGSDTLPIASRTSCSKLGGV